MFFRYSEDLGDKFHNDPKSSPALVLTYSSNFIRFYK